MNYFDESGLRLYLANFPHFRFQDLPAYGPLKGQRLKEMDFCWQDESNRIVMLELKEFTRSRETLRASDLVDKAYRFETLINKVTDSLLMLAAVWLGTQKGLAFRDGMPQFVQQRLPIKIIIGLDLPQSLHSHYGVLRDKLNTRLRGRVALFDIDSIAVLNYQQLLEKYPNFIVVP